MPLPATPPRFAAHPVGPSPRTDGAVRVATFNLWFGHRADDALEVITSDPHLRDSHLLALQEVDEILAARLAGALGMGYVYHPAIRHPRTRRHFGPALLSRWPAVTDGCLALPHAGVHRMPRVATWASYLVGSELLTVHAVHFSTMREVFPWQQADQARVTAGHAGAYPGRGIIVGDLNRRGLAAEFTRQGWDWPTRGIGRTHHIWSFDHVFSRGLQPTGKHGVVAASRRASDHLAVWADLGGA